jgi:hypothetical protein
MKLDPRFWKNQPQAIKSTYEDVNDRFAVVSMAGIGWDDATWACIDKQFSVGHVFHNKISKLGAINFCLDF